MRPYSLLLSLFCAGCAVGGLLSLNGWLFICGALGAVLNLASFIGFE